MSQALARSEFEEFLAPIIYALIPTSTQINFETAKIIIYHLFLHENGPKWRHTRNP